MSCDQDKRTAANAKVCQELAEQMLSFALRAGADGAEVLVRDGAELEVKIRMGETELIKEAGSRGLGLRVLKEDRAAVTYTSDFDAQAMGVSPRNRWPCAAWPSRIRWPRCPAARRWRGRSLRSTCGTSLFFQSMLPRPCAGQRRVNRPR